jgi:hypothetical protein
MKIIDIGVSRRRGDWTEIKWLTMLNSTSHTACQASHPRDAQARPPISVR